MAKVKFSVYADEEIKKALDKMADKEERSLAYVTARALKFYFDNLNKKIVEEDIKEEENIDEAFINKNFNPDEVEEI